MFASTALAAPELLESIEKIADEHYYRQQTINLLYDKHVNYEAAYSCTKVAEKIDGVRIDIVCAVNDRTNDVLAITISKSTNGYAKYIMVCPTGFDGLDPFDLGDLAFKSDPSYIDGVKGTMHYMGRTNGWVKDFENIFASYDSGFSKASCWALNKR